MSKWLWFTAMQRCKCSFVFFRFICMWPRLSWPVPLPSWIQNISDYNSQQALELEQCTIPDGGGQRPSHQTDQTRPTYNSIGVGVIFFAATLHMSCHITFPHYNMPIAYHRAVRYRWLLRCRTLSHCKASMSTSWTLTTWCTSKWTHLQVQIEGVGGGGLLIFGSS